MVQIKSNKLLVRDTGHNNIIKRPHLELYKLDLPTCLEDAVPVFQKMVYKIEHKLKRCEDFLSNNKNEIRLSYYTEGYYNGRARAFEDIIDLIKDVINESAEEEQQ